MRLLQYKMAAFVELEPSLAETAIGEVDELSTSTEHETLAAAAVAFVTAAAGFDISAVMTEVDWHQPSGDVGLSTGLGTLHEM